jgi:hypothetical protein
MIKFALTTALLTLAAPALAQTPVPTRPAPAAPAAPASAATPTPEFIQAGTAFGQCLGRTAQQAPPTATPEAAAHQAVAGCATERAAMDARFESWISGPSFPADKRDLARSQYKAQLSGVEAQISAQLNTQRAAATPAPAPAPTAAPTPTPKR